MMEQYINKIFNEDCLEFMKQLPDNCIDCIVTDPPYGKMWTRGKNGIGLVKDKNEDDKTFWDVKPDKVVFNEIFRISKNQIIFGGNYFTKCLPESNCWIVWDKLGDLKLGKQIPFAHCELIWTSFNKTVKKYTLRQQGFISDSNDKRVHPTQKPTELIQMILNDYTKKDDIICDMYMGSGTTAVACINTGRRFIGCELDKGYFDIAQKRIDDYNKQLKLF